jgi:hypothetical protein
LSPVIEALEEKKDGKHQKVDLMIVVNLFPRKGQVPSASISFSPPEGRQWQGVQYEAGDAA